MTLITKSNTGEVLGKYIIASDPVYATQPKFQWKGAFLFLRLDLPSTFIPDSWWKQELFENALITRVIWKRRIFVLECTKKTIDNGVFENDDVMIITCFPCPKQILNDNLLLRFQISWAYCGQKKLMRFQSEIAVFKILRCSLNGASVFNYSRCRSPYSLSESSNNHCELTRMVWSATVQTRWKFWGSTVLC